jgi:hypothetical protein
MKALSIYLQCHCLVEMHDWTGTSILQISCSLRHPSSKVKPRDSYLGDRLVRWWWWWWSLRVRERVLEGVRKKRTWRPARAVARYPRTRSAPAYPFRAFCVHLVLCVRSVCVCMCSGPLPNGLADTLRNDEVPAEATIRI